MPVSTRDEFLNYAFKEALHKNFFQLMSLPIMLCAA
ncbi:MAG: hypothetical protein A4E53_01010 [Pelotomaculum sp. PtaB.Bin104]|nr:MAG: hypothetical protein A4E53_01010 [Pelotomaculum sp. PtaB.Bin104]